MTAVARDEVEAVRGIEGDLVQGTTAGGDRARDREPADQERRAHRERDARGGAEHGPRVARPAEDVEEEERHRPESEVQVGEGDRRDSRRGKRQPAAAPAPRALVRPQCKRQQHGDHPAQVARALRHAVGRELERQPPGERGAARQAELPQPEVREPAGGEVGQEQQHVPPGDRAEGRPERPVGQPERPAAEVHARAALGPERVRVEPGCVTVLELVADEPEVVDGLQVVAHRRLAVDHLRPRGEVRAEVLRRRPHRRQADGEVERAGERYKARAAESSSSKSGTSASS